jgi:hypothetical protein
VRRLGLAAGLALLVAVVAVSASASADTAGRRHGCGTISSTSIYARAKVIALRGVGCRKARNVAKRFDHTGDLAIGHWRCALAHSDLPNLFSCGWPATGNLRQAEHALLARGVPGT